jgi:hypothetical protein
MTLQDVSGRPLRFHRWQRDCRPKWPIIRDKCGTAYRHFTFLKVSGPSRSTEKEFEKRDFDFWGIQASPKRDFSGAGEPAGKDRESRDGEAGGYEVRPRDASKKGEEIPRKGHGEIAIWGYPGIPQTGFQKSDEEGMEAGLIKRRSAPERGRGGGNRSKNRTDPLNRP